jgi:hypothetical protein
MSALLSNQGLLTPTTQLMGEFRMVASNDIGARDVAEYVRDLALELSYMARRAGLVSVAGGLEQAHRAADAELRAASVDRRKRRAGGRRVAAWQ